MASLHCSAAPSFANALAVDGSGNIIVAGACGQPWFSYTVRFTAAGKLDTQYAITTISSTLETNFNHIVLQNDGKAVVAGNEWLDSTDSYDSVVVR